MSKRTLRVATRSSALALWQAEFIKAELERLHDNVVVELVKIKTQGDKILDVPLAKIGGKGLFVKELEEAMLDGRADLAVHSMKDVPMAFPEGLGLVAICEREDPTDAFVSNHYDNVDALPHGSVVGTASLRRESQLRAYRPDLEIRVLRGNVNTRLAKLDAGDYDASNVWAFMTGFATPCQTRCRCRRLVREPSASNAGSMMTNCALCWNP